MLALLLACVVAAAVGGAAGSPSAAQASFERAVAATLAAPSFEYQGDTFGPSAAVGYGVYRAPAQVEVWVSDDRLDHLAVRYSVYHSTLRVAFRRGVTFSIPVPGAPFAASVPPLLPPLAALRSATDVERSLQTYSLVVPSLTVPFSGWVACTARGTCSSPPVAVAHDVHATATVSGGYLVALALPRVVAGDRVVQPPSVWRFSRIGTVPATVAPPVFH